MSTNNTQGEQKRLCSLIVHVRHLGTVQSIGLLYFRKVQSQMAYMVFLWDYL